MFILNGQFVDTMSCKIIVQIWLKFDVLRIGLIFASIRIFYSRLCLKLLKQTTICEWWKFSKRNYIHIGTYDFCEYVSWNIMQTDRKICAYRYLLGSMGDLHKFFSRKENNATDDRTPTSQDGLVSSWKSFAHSINSGKYLENHLRYCYLNGNVNRWMNAKRIFCFSYWVLGYKNIRYSWFRQVHKMFCQ